MAKFIEVGGTLFLMEDSLEFTLKSAITLVEIKVAKIWPEARDHEVKQVARNIIKNYLKQMER